MWLSVLGGEDRWAHLGRAPLAAALVAMLVAGCVGERSPDVSTDTAWVGSSESCPTGNDALRNIRATAGNASASSIVNGPIARNDIPSTCCYPYLDLAGVGLPNSLETPDGNCVLAHEDGTCPTDSELFAQAYFFSSRSRPSTFGIPTVHGPQSSCFYDVKR